MTKLAVSLISTAAEAERLFVHAARSAEELWLASAWASDGTAAATALWRARGRVSALAVGLDFHQTDPAFLARFRALARVHEVANGTFHPKVYVFRRGAMFEAIIGSSNFTRGGFGPNVESNVRIRGPRSKFFLDLTAFVSRLADRGRLMLDVDLEHYAREHAKKQQSVLCARQFHRRQHTSHDEMPLHIGWRAFAARLRSQQRRTGHPLFPSPRSPGYIGVVEEIQRIFRAKRRLSGMTLDERRKVAGLVSPFTYFGSMTGAGHFKSYVRIAHASLDRALDQIPTRGPVAWADLDGFRRALPAPGMSTPAVGSRLLAMKRPDRFLCIDSANRANLSRAFGIPKQRLNSYDGYWELLQLIWRCPWFKSRTPEGEEARIWRARVALVDAFYYEQ